MYVTEPPTTVTALDPRTGRTLWSHVRPMPSDLRLIGFPATNRGVAILDDMRVRRRRSTACLIALDAETGAKRWETKVADNGTGHSITMAPLALDGKIVVGISGGEAGIRGFVDAYDAKTGARLWRTYTVPGPGEPGRGDLGRRQLEERRRRHLAHRLLRSRARSCSTGARAIPGPDWNGDVRMGDNLYTSSVVALDADTGKLKWHFQYTPHDTHDWDANQIQVLADLHHRRASAQDAAARPIATASTTCSTASTGEFLHAAPYREADLGEGHRREGSARGTAQYRADRRGNAGLSEPPGLHELAEPVVQPADRPVLRRRCARWARTTSRPTWSTRPACPSPAAASARLADEAWGAVRALDARTGAKVWDFKLPSPSWSGVMSTAGGLVFSGSNEGNFYALDAKTGHGAVAVPDRRRGCDRTR